MLKIFLRRIAILVPILFGITIAVFSLEALSPSDPAEVSIRENAMVPTPELIALTRHELGLDQPFLTRYGHWVSGVLHGDLGKSYITGRDVAGDIAAALSATLELAFAALLITAVVATVSGVLCARHPGSRTDAAIRSLIFLTSAFPAFWAGMLLMWLFAVKFDLFPTSGRNGLSSVVLPAATLSLAYISTYARLIRTEMIETKHQNWVLFARSRGLPERTITAHVLLNSLRGAAVSLGMSIPKLVAGAFVVECIFAWPGIGRLCVSAIFNRDFPVIEAYVLITSTLFVLFNLASDLFIAWLDPRERMALNGSAK